MHPEPVSSRFPSRLPRRAPLLSLDLSGTQHALDRFAKRSGGAKTAAGRCPSAGMAQESSRPLMLPFRGEFVK